MNRYGFAAARLRWPAYLTVGNGKITLSEKIALLLHPHVDVPLLRNLTLDGKLCLSDDKNAAFL